MQKLHKDLTIWILVTKEFSLPLAVNWGILSRMFPRWMMVFGSAPSMRVTTTHRAVVMISTYTDNFFL